MKSREIALAALVAIGLPAALPEPSASLTFTADRITKWSDIKFTVGDEAWAVKDSSVDIFALSGHYQAWEGEIEGPMGDTKRVTCTSGTTLPANGGSFFQANCQLR